MAVEAGEMGSRPDLGAMTQVDIQATYLEAPSDMPPRAAKEAHGPSSPNLPGLRRPGVSPPSGKGPAGRTVLLAVPCPDRPSPLQASVPHCLHRQTPAWASGRRTRVRRAGVRRGGRKFDVPRLPPTRTHRRRPPKGGRHGREADDHRTRAQPLTASESRGAHTARPPAPRVNVRHLAQVGT